MAQVQHEGRDSRQTQQSIASNGKPIAGGPYPAQHPAQCRVGPNGMLPLAGVPTKNHARDFVQFPCKAFQHIRPAINEGLQQRVNTPVLVRRASSRWIKSTTASKPEVSSKRTVT